MDSGLVDAARAGIEIMMDLKGVDIVLQTGKSTKVEQPGGGYVYTEGAARDSQRFAISDLTGTGTSRTPTDSGSTALTRRLELTGRYDSEADVGDYWIAGETRYTIDELVVSNEYVKKWALIATGPEGPHG